MITITFTRQVSPIDARFCLLAELRDSQGRRFWAAWGTQETELFERAACWLDDCHGRAGHTPPIMLGPVGVSVQVFSMIERDAQRRQAARLR